MGYWTRPNITIICLADIRHLELTWFLNIETVTFIHVFIHFKHYTLDSLDRTDINFFLFVLIRFCGRKYHINDHSLNYFVLDIQSELWKPLFETFSHTIQLALLLKLPNSQRYPENSQRQSSINNILARNHVKIVALSMDRDCDSLQ